MTLMINGRWPEGPRLSAHVRSQCPLGRLAAAATEAAAVTLIRAALTDSELAVTFQEMFGTVKPRTQMLQEAPLTVGPALAPTVN
jgi:hypothetical protein